MGLLRTLVCSVNVTRRGTIVRVARWIGMETKAYERSHDHTGRLVAASLFVLWTAVSVAAALAE
jgi:hypothetical protein